MEEAAIMEHMRVIAYETVLRACGFGSLAIFCVMIGLSFEPRAAFQAGGFLTLLMTVILLLKAYEARTKNYRRTEMWLYLPRSSGRRKPMRNGRSRRSCGRPICCSPAGRQSLPSRWGSLHCVFPSSGADLLFGTGRQDVRPAHRGVRWSCSSSHILGMP